MPCTLKKRPILTLSRESLQTSDSEGLPAHKALWSLLATQVWATPALVLG